jgi:hypothetical protein
MRIELFSLSLILYSHTQPTALAIDGKRTCDDRPEKWKNGKMKKKEKERNQGDSLSHSLVLQKVYSIHGERRL